MRNASYATNLIEYMNDLLNSFVKTEERINVLVTLLKDGKECRLIGVIAYEKSAFPQFLHTNIQVVTPHWYCVRNGE
jgi:hypothetical protein